MQLVFIHPSCSCASHREHVNSRRSLTSVSGESCASVKGSCNDRFMFVQTTMQAVMGILDILVVTVLAKTLAPIWLVGLFCGKGLVPHDWRVQEFLPPLLWTQTSFPICCFRPTQMPHVGSVTQGLWTDTHHVGGLVVFYGRIVCIIHDSTILLLYIMATRTSPEQDKRRLLESHRW